MHPLAITPIPAFTDNYIWLLESGRSAVVVDPGDAKAVERALQDRGLELRAVLVTHHHMDHIGGLPELHRRFGVPVYGPAAEADHIPGLTHRLEAGERITPEGLEREFQVIPVPGHTRGHIAFYTSGFVLCGDTLFSAGCGRLFEGTPQQMHASLSKLSALPDDTAVYCTHEYTLANLAFARTIEPGNSDVQAEIVRAREQRRQKRPTLPSSIDREHRINPFLRCHVPEVVEAAERHAGTPLGSATAVFATLRRWKDGFRAPEMD
jgi:hydroxyacylglutathione hydrolase